MKFIKPILTRFWTGLALAVIYFYWSGMRPERMKGTASGGRLTNQK